MRRWIALAAGMALWPVQAALAQAQTDWVGLSANANGARFYALAHELVPVKASDAEPTLWVKQTPTPAQGFSWFEGHALYQVNCQEQSYKILSVTLFYPDGTNQSHSGEDVVRRVVPQTPLAGLAARVCPAEKQASARLTALTSAAGKL